MYIQKDKYLPWIMKWGCNQHWRMACPQGDIVVGRIAADKLKLSFDPRIPKFLIIQACKGQARIQHCVADIEKWDLLWVKRRELNKITIHSHHWSTTDCSYESKNIKVHKKWRPIQEVESNETPFHLYQRQNKIDKSRQHKWRRDNHLRVLSALRQEYEPSSRKGNRVN